MRGRVKVCRASMSACTPCRSAAYSPTLGMSRMTRCTASRDAAALAQSCSIWSVAEQIWKQRTMTPRNCATSSALTMCAHDDRDAQRWVHLPLASGAELPRSRSSQTPSSW